MSLAAGIRSVELALKRSSKCAAGLFGRCGVFGMERGPSGGQEILAAMYLDYSVFGFWYGHIQMHPTRNRTYVALLVWTTKMVNAPNVPLLFRRFHYWVKDRLHFEPSTIQSVDDAYAEAGNIDLAALELSRMIMNFDVDKRTGLEGTGFERCPSEMRILEIYGVKNTADDQGRFPRVPMPLQLALVESGSARFLNES